MMPKLQCKRCSQEFWGWKLFHTGKDGEWVCPDCGGSLKLVADRRMAGQERDERLDETSVA